MAIDNNRYIDILIIDGQSMTKIFVIIHYHQLSISIDGNPSIKII